MILNNLIIIFLLKINFQNEIGCVYSIDENFFLSQIGYIRSLLGGYFDELGDIMFTTFYGMLLFFSLVNQLNWESGVEKSNNTSIKSKL